MMEQGVHYCTIPFSVTAFAHISTRSGYRIYFSVLCSSAPTYMLSLAVHRPISLRHVLVQTDEYAMRGSFTLRASESCGTEKRFLASFNQRFF